MEIRDSAAIDEPRAIDVIGARQPPRGVGEIELAFAQIDIGDDAVDIVDREQALETMRVAMHDHQRFALIDARVKVGDAIGADQVAERIIEPLLVLRHASVRS
jgi:hypothetical protein